MTDLCTCGHEAHAGGECEGSEYARYDDGTEEAIRCGCRLDMRPKVLAVNGLGEPMMTGRVSDDLSQPPSGSATREDAERATSSEVLASGPDGAPVMREEAPAAVAPYQCATCGRRHWCELDHVTHKCDQAALDAKYGRPPVAASGAHTHIGGEIVYPEPPNAGTCGCQAGAGVVREWRANSGYGEELPDELSNAECAAEHNACVARVRELEADFQEARHLNGVLVDGAKQIQAGQQDRIRELQAEIERLRGELAELHAVLDANNLQDTTLRMEVERLNVALKNAIDEANATRQAYATEVERLRARLADIEDERDSAKATNDLALATLKKADADVERYAKERDDAVRRLARAEAVVDAARRCTTEGMTDLEIAALAAWREGKP